MIFHTNLDLLNRPFLTPATVSPKTAKNRQSFSNPFLAAILHLESITKPL